jgi:hypothetical protein
MHAGREHSRKRPPLLVLLFNCHAKIPAVRIQTRSFLTDISWTNSYFHAFDQLPLFILQHDKIVVKYPHGPTVRCAPSIFNSVVDLLTMTQCARVSNMNFWGPELWNGESFRTPILSVTLAVLTPFLNVQLLSSPNLTSFHYQYRKTYLCTSRSCSCTAFTTQSMRL